MYYLQPLETMVLHLTEKMKDFIFVRYQCSKIIKVPGFMKRQYKNLLSSKIYQNKRVAVFD